LRGKLGASLNDEGVLSLAKQTLNTVRINAGEWRSRLLKFPDAQGLRPTPERVRQTVFNWLGQDLTGLNCLDLFAGTGVMGFEALSRNAKSAVLVEKSAVVCKAILDNKTALKAEAAKVLNEDAQAFCSIIVSDSMWCFWIRHTAWVCLTKSCPYCRRISRQMPWCTPRLSLKSSRMKYWQVLKHSKAGNVFYHL